MAILVRLVSSSQERPLTPQGLIHYRLKPPYWDGTAHAVFEPLDFMAPKPRVNLTAITCVCPEQPSACTGDPGPTRRTRWRSTGEDTAVCRTAADGMGERTEFEHVLPAAAFGKTGHLMAMSDFGSETQIQTETLPILCAREVLHYNCAKISSLISAFE